MADASPPAPKASEQLSATSSSTAESASEPAPASAKRGTKRGASSTRGTSAARTTRARKPPNVGRRSKEERDAVVREALEQERVRKAERDAAIRRENRGIFRGGRGRGRGEKGGRGRGGFMGDGPVSGPFSQGRSTAAEKNRQQQAGFGGPSGSRATIKKETRGDEEEEAEMNRALGFSTSKIKKEKDMQDGGYVSSDDDDDQFGPRLDIDAIDVSSGEEGEDAEGKTQDSSMPRMLMPIRIPRREHQDRVVGINTEASAGSSAKTMKQTEKKGASTTEATESSNRKGKAKVKDLEITEVRKPYKGMWQDSDDKGEQVRIKDEPVDDDAAITAPEATEVKTAEKEESPQADRKSHLKGKGRLRRRSGALDSKPSLQTAEDKQEWERSQLELENILVELGQTQFATATEDRDGDTDMKTGEETKDMKEDRVYLFQFPPIVPDLLPAPIKKEAQEETAPIIPTNNQTPIKIEDNDTKPTQTSSTLTSGRVGKLRVHQSGKVTLNWGGMSLEIKKGMSTHFLQDTVVTRITPESERLNAGDMGDALGFGQVRGKFVVTPDWSAML